MEITRNVILDLLPLYLANEVSADTRALVEKYLETDPELTNAAKKLAPLEKPGDIPVRLSQDAEVKAYKKARWLQLLIILIFAGALSILLVITLLVFFLGSS
jgi:hypothetical protein